MRPLLLAAQAALLLALAAAGATTRVEATAWSRLLRGVDAAALAPNAVQALVLAQPSNATYMTMLLRPGRSTDSLAALEEWAKSDLAAFVANLTDAQAAVRTAELSNYLSNLLTVANVVGGLTGLTVTNVLNTLVTWGAPIAAWFETTFLPPPPTVNSVVVPWLGVVGSNLRAYRTQILALRAILVLTQPPVRTSPPPTSPSSRIELNHLSVLDPYEFSPAFAGYTTPSSPATFPALIDLGSLTSAPTLMPTTKTPSSPPPTNANAAPVPPPTTKSPTPAPRTQRPTFNTAVPPPSLDWRDFGVVSPVVNQGSCGSCWAHAAAAVLESRYAVANSAKSTTPLSPQQVTSCATQSSGCGGGNPSAGWSYSIAAKGIASSATYPYTSFSTPTSQSATPPCDANLEKEGIILAAGSTLQAANDNDIIKALLKGGPVSAAVVAGQPCFQQYASGVITASSSCTNTPVDHAVVIVGYGVDKDAGPYFLIKNSWGTGWGEDGYARIARGLASPGTVGLLTAASYPESATVSPACAGVNADSSSTAPTPAFCAKLVPTAAPGDRIPSVAVHARVASAVAAMTLTTIVVACAMVVL